LIVAIKQKQIWNFNATSNEGAIKKQENWRDGTKDEAKKAKFQGTIDRLGKAATLYK